MGNVAPDITFAHPRRKIEVLSRMTERTHQRTTLPSAQVAAEALLEMLADAGYMQAEPATLETMSFHQAYTFYAPIDDDLLLQVDVDCPNNACRCQLRADQQKLWELTYDEQGWHTQDGSTAPMSPSVSLPLIVRGIEHALASKR